MFAPMASTVIMPMLLLSGALLPMSAAPGRLDAISRDAVPLRGRGPAGGLHRPLRLGRRGRRCRGVPGFAVIAVTIGTRTFTARHA
jgi:ABC-2 type transport system permease protein